MKKMLVLLSIAVVALSLSACNSSDYKVDGTFTAYSVEVHSYAPMVTTVSVTIKDGDIESYYIDARQGARVQTAGIDTPDDDSDDTYSFAWNSQTKKELGDDYHMVEYGGAIAEWYEQAESIEAYFLANGVEDVPTITNEEGEYFDGIAGVTMKNGSYIELAQEALELAKEGKFQAVLCADDDLYSASMIVDKKGNFSELELDVLQGKPDGAEFAWNSKTKQELQFEYGMKDSPYASGLTYTNGEWVETGNAPTLEWFEQAALITDYITENGWNSSLDALDSRGGTIDGTSLVDDLSGATIHTGTYYDVLAKLFESANLD
jgi:major membrane immunogen (membrane-anchored lipoprotein)